MAQHLLVAADMYQVGLHAHRKHVSASMSIGMRFLFLMKQARACASLCHCSGFHPRISYALKACRALISATQQAAAAEALNPSCLPHVPLWQLLPALPAIGTKMHLYSQLQSAKTPMLEASIYVALLNLSSTRRFGLFVLTDAICHLPSRSWGACAASASGGCARRWTWRLWPRLWRWRNRTMRRSSRGCAWTLSAGTWRRCVGCRGVAVQGVEVLGETEGWGRSQVQWWGYAVAAGGCVSCVAGGLSSSGLAWHVLVQEAVSGCMGQLHLVVSLVLLALHGCWHFGGQP